MTSQASAGVLRSCRSQQHLLPHYVHNIRLSTHQYDHLFRSVTGLSSVAVLQAGLALLPGSMVTMMINTHNNLSHHMCDGSVLQQTSCCRWHSSTSFRHLPNAHPLDKGRGLSNSTTHRV